MNKAERLFQLMSVLQSRRRAVTAEQLADKMNVSVRTIYRDIQALELSGVSISGEPGVGYMLRPGSQIPPLMFNNDELQSLLVGIQMVRAFTDRELAGAAQKAEDKILAVMPNELKQLAENQPYRIPMLERDDHKRDIHLLLRQACEQKLKLTFDYSDENQKKSQRTVWPLGMIGWGEVWTLLAWCELRKDYRNFRFDRMGNVNKCKDTFETSPKRCLEHYFKAHLDVD